MSQIAAVNTRNQFRGKVIGIKRSPVVSEVEIEFKATEVLVAAVAKLD